MSRAVQAWEWRALVWLLATSINFCELHAKAITIATYNVENYVATDRRVDGAYRPAYPKPEAVPPGETSARNGGFGSSAGQEIRHRAFGFDH